MSGDARQFALEIDREWAEQMDDVRDAVTYVALAGVSGVVQKSPVDTGRFKGNWGAGISSPDTTVTETVDPSGQATIAAAHAVIAKYDQFEGFPAIFLTNNLPYAQRLEDGWSKQAPGGMVALTVVELAALWEGMSV